MDRDTEAHKHPTRPTSRDRACHVLALSAMRTRVNYQQDYES